MDPPTKPYVVLVTGSRSWTDAECIERVLLAETKDRKVVRLVHGGAAGADQLAHKVAVKLGWQYKTYTPKWKELGRRAGLERNSDMLREEDVDLVLAFPTKTSTGTWDMVRKAQRAGKSVIIERSKLN